MATRDQIRGSIFQAAYKRAKRALKAGFYIEAIALCESLIADRLRVIIQANLEMDVEKAPAGTCAKVLQDKKIGAFDFDLWNDCLIWTRGRNKHAHEMGKISGHNPQPWRSRLKEARSVAERGFSIVNRVSAEAKKHRF